MALALERRNERGEVLASNAADDGRLYRAITALTGETPFPMLESIDPYGDTIFNPQQCRTLLAEIQRAGTPDLSALAAEASAVADGTHVYLWVIGD